MLLSKITFIQAKINKQIFLFFIWSNTNQLGKIIQTLVVISLVSNLIKKSRCKLRPTSLNINWYNRLTGVIWRRQSNFEVTSWQSQRKRIATQHYLIVICTSMWANLYLRKHFVSHDALYLATLHLDYKGVIINSVKVFN